MNTDGRGYARAAAGAPAERTLAVTLFPDKA